MDYHERMKQYYDLRAPEYKDAIPGLGDKAENPEAVEGIHVYGLVFPEARIRHGSCAGHDPAARCAAVLEQRMVRSPRHGTRGDGGAFVARRRMFR